MICRKCGAEIPDNALRCEHCGIKVNMYCPECNTLNPFGSKYCSNCGFELIKICPKCNTSNLFSAVECRKCHHSFQAQTQIADEPNITEDLSIVVNLKFKRFNPKKFFMLKKKILTNPL